MGKAFARLSFLSDPVIVVLDMDFYLDMDQVVRPRELGWAMAPSMRVASLGAESWTCGSTYFIDSPDMCPLDTSLANVRYVHDHLTGLEINPTENTYAKSTWPVYWSTQLIDALQQLVEACRFLSPRAVFLFKGGQESVYLRQTGLLRPHDTVIDIGDFGCPKFDALMRLPHVASGSSHTACAHHHPVRPDEALKGGIVHCPRQETHVFGQWWVEVGHGRAMVFESVRILDMKILTILWSFMDTWTVSPTTRLTSSSYAAITRMSSSSSSNVVVPQPPSVSTKLSNFKHKHKDVSKKQKHRF